METLYFTHIPRTGGTTITAVLTPYSDKNFRFVKNGHAPYSDHLKKQLSTDENPVVKSLICLRCPIQHMSSLYSYIKIDRGNPAHKYAAKYNFSDWLRVREEYISNYYSVFFSRSGNKNIKLDPHEVIKKFDIIINTKFLNRDLTNLLANYGISYEPTHRNKSNRTPISKEDESFIRKIREKDFKLLESIRFDF